jgi:hypothetical protein
VIETKCRRGLKRVRTTPREKVRDRLQDESNSAPKWAFGDACRRENRSFDAIVSAPQRDYIRQRGHPHVVMPSTARSPCLRQRGEGELPPRARSRPDEHARGACSSAARHRVGPSGADLVMDSGVVTRVGVTPQPSPRNVSHSNYRVRSHAGLTPPALFPPSGLRGADVPQWRPGKSH